jgi:hypothetical protein
VCGLEVGQDVFAAGCEGDDVVDGVGLWVEVVGVVVDGLGADAAGWVAAGELAAVPVAAGGVAAWALGGGHGLDAGDQPDEEDGEDGDDEGAVDGHGRPPVWSSWVAGPVGLLSPVPG